jgi:DNA polymerase-3 subunit beta
VFAVGVERLLTIGEFAERCGLSRSALRFYDQNELLRPQLVDDETGYRYYAIGQLEQAVLVRRLRMAEVPVGVLRRYLAAGGEGRRAILDAHVASFRERASAVETAVDELRRDLAGVDRAGGGRFCEIAAAQLAAAIQQVSFAIADPAVRAELGAVWVETKEDSLRLVATDTHRLAVRDLVPDQIGSDALRGVIDAEHAGVLSAERATAGAIELSQDEAGEITATVDGRRTSVGHSGTGFPDYERILSGVPAGDQIALPRDALTRALAELPSQTDQLSLEFEPEALLLRTQGIRARVAGRWSGRSLRVLVDTRYFAEAVNATVGPDVVIEAFDPLQPITLRSADTGTFSVLTMPIRPPDAG